MLRTPQAVRTPAVSAANDANASCRATCSNVRRMSAAWLTPDAERRSPESGARACGVTCSAVPARCLSKHSAFCPSALDGAGGRCVECGRGALPRTRMRASTCASAAARRTPHCGDSAPTPSVTRGGERICAVAAFLSPSHRNLAGAGPRRLSVPAIGTKLRGSAREAAAGGTWPTAPHRPGTRRHAALGTRRSEMLHSAQECRR